MKTIDLFYQGEGITDLDVVELQPESTFAVLKKVLVQKHGIVHEDLLIFLEDQDEPVDEMMVIAERISKQDCKVHLHRCRHVHVTVSFNGDSVDHLFAPSATVARVKHWAGVEKFGMSEVEAGEHVLQIDGTHDRPTPGSHIGALTDGNVCSVAFNLVPDERVQGST